VTVLTAIAFERDLTLGRKVVDQVVREAIGQCRGVFLGEVLVPRPYLCPKGAQLAECFGTTLLFAECLNLFVGRYRHDDGPGLAVALDDHLVALLADVAKPLQYQAL